MTVIFTTRSGLIWEYVNVFALEWISPHTWAITDIHGRTVIVDVAQVSMTYKAYKAGDAR